MIALPVALLLFQSVNLTQAEDANSKGVRIYSDLVRKVGEIKRLEATVSLVGEVQPGRFVKFASQFRIATDPFRYVATIESTEPKFRESVTFDGRWQRTSSEGKVEAKDLDFPDSWRVVSGWCATVPVSTISRLLNLPKMRAALDSRAVIFLLEESVEGKPCNLIQTTSISKEGEPSVSTALIWISKETGWPVAFQSSSYVRSKVTIGQRIVFVDWRPNPKWVDEPFAVHPTATDSYGTLEPKISSAVSERVTVGQLLPDFTLQDPKLKSVSLRSLITGRTLSSFWASWCGPCKAEMRSFKSSKAIARLGVKVISIGVFDSKGNLERYLPELSNVPTTVLYDPDCERQVSPITTFFGIKGIPTSIVVDENGRIAGHWVGFTNVEELDIQLRKAFQSSN